MRATDTLFSTTAQFQILRAPTSSNGTTFGPGSANNLLKSNGTSVYWTTLVASDIPNLSTDKLTSGTLGVTRGGTGVTAIANIQAGKDGDGNTISSTYLKLSGGTLTGNITVTKAGDTYVRVHNTETGIYCYLDSDAKSTGGNHGIYSTGYWDGSSYVANAKWLICRKQGGNVIVNGDCTGSAGSVAWGNVSGKPTGNAVNYNVMKIGSGSWSTSQALIPLIGTDGVMEVGKYIDFHDSTTEKDYAVRITASTSGISISGTTSGTFSGNLTGTATKATQDADGNTISSTYLKLSGGTLTGNLTLSATSGNSPALIFNRDGSLTDWRIFVTGGKLSFQSTTDASTWAERASFANNSGNFTTTGTITATKFIGPLEGNVTGNATNVTGTVAVDHGGTGATTAAAARTNLEITPANIGAVSKAGDTMTGQLTLQPTGDEGGQILLEAPSNHPERAGINIDQYSGSSLRIFGNGSADGTSYTGVGNTLVINPYAATITGGYTFTGNVTGNASDNVLKSGDTMTGPLNISFNATPLFHGTRTDSGEASIYLNNNTSGWALGVNAWGVGANSFAIGRYAGASGGGCHLWIDGTGLVGLSKALPVASGGTGATSESGARSNLKVPYSPGPWTLSSFSQIPTEAGFYMVTYSGTDTEAPITTISDYWWNIIQIGVASRLVQIANNAYLNRNKVFMRVKHDSKWYGWFKFEGTSVSN